MGYGDLGCYGQKKIETPHIDALARTGMRFTQHYSASAVSAPSRCMMLTGKHSGHAAIRGNEEMASRGNVWNHQAMLDNPRLEGQAPLPANTRTLAHLMQDAGYATAMIGKWGLGFPGSHSTPNKMGFDFFYGYNCQRQAHTYFPMFLYRNDEREMLDNAPLLHAHARVPKDADPKDEAVYERYSRKQYSNDLMFEELTTYVSEQSKAKKPFFLMWTTPLPHVALQAPKKWVDYYVKKWGDEAPYTGNRDYLPCRYPRATYAAMISYFDEQVGELVKQLKKEGLYENTIIIFTSDNGPTFNGGSSSPWFESAGPFRCEQGWGKASLREGGIRVPLIVSWPAKLTKKRKSDHISASWDMYRTLAEVVGQEVEEDKDGISFLPELLGKKQKEHESLYWEFPENGGSKAVRMGKWKGLILRTNSGNNKIQLYNLDRDPREENDLADKNPRVVAQIRKIMEESHTPPPAISK